MKTKLWVITIMIVFLLGLLPLNSSASEVTDEPSKKTPEPKEEVIKSLKAKDENEEDLTDEKSMDTESVPKVSDDKKQIEKTKPTSQDQIDKDKIYFSKRSHSLDTKSQKILNDTANWLKNNPKVALVIEGYGNEYKNSEKNLLLGELRGGSVKSYLIKQGINPSRLIVVSYGSERSSRTAKKMGIKNWRVCFLVKELENK